MAKPKLNQLEMLAAVADTGSFGGAAAALDCTQSRISHGIAELEGALGLRLLHRSRSGCVPTEAGHAVVAKARQMLKLAASLGDIAQEHAGLQGHVRIACFRSVGTHLLPGALAELAADHPGIRIDVDDGMEARDGAERAVLDGQAGIAIAQLPVSSRLATRRYAADAYMLVLPAAQALIMHGSWEQLAELPYIQLDCTGALAMAERCREAGLRAAPARTLAADSSIVAMVKKGMGYAILPRLAVHPLPDGVRAIPLPGVPAAEARRQFVVAALPDTLRQPAARMLVRYLTSTRVLQQTDAFRLGLLQN